MIDLGRFPNLIALSEYLRARGIDHGALGVTDGALHTYDAAGRPAALPAEATALVASWTPPARPLLPSDRLAALGQPRVITGSRGTDTARILAALLRICADAGIVIDQTRE